MNKMFFVLFCMIASFICSSELPLTQNDSKKIDVGGLIQSVKTDSPKRHPSFSRVRRQSLGSVDSIREEEHKVEYKINDVPNKQSRSISK